MYKQLSYGITAPGVLRKEIESMLSGIDEVGCFFDDTIICDIAELNDRLYVRF